MKKTHSKMSFDFENTFPPLGHPEHHFNKWPDHPWLKTKNEIIDWLDSNLEKAAFPNDKYIIHEDYTISSLNELRLKTNSKYTSLPVQFRTCKEFRAFFSDLTNLYGIPYKCENVNLTYSNIVSFEGVSEFFSGTISLSLNKITSLSTAPYFKKDPLLKLNTNPINNFDDFNNSCRLCIVLPESYNNYDSIINLSEKIEEIIIDPPVIISDKIKVNNMRIDMDWLKEERLLKKTELLTDSINQSVNVHESRNNNKRKI